jgi:hypothetical protein
MSIKDLHNNIRAMTVQEPRALATVAGSKTQKVIDRQDYGGVEFIISYSATGASTAAIPVVVKDGDVSGTLASVANDYLLGTEALAGIGLVARTSGLGKNVTKRIGYVGSKRYVTCGIGTVSAAVVSASKIFAITAVLHSPKLGPASNP